jgi:hypothetical protein
MASFEFFSDIILPVALWPWGWLSLYQKWVPGVFPGSKDGQCTRLTTLPPFCAAVMKSGNLNFLEPCGPLQACDGTALPLLAEVSCYQLLGHLTLIYSLPGYKPWCHGGINAYILRPDTFLPLPLCRSYITATINFSHWCILLSYFLTSSTLAIASSDMV